MICYTIVYNCTISCIPIIWVLCFRDSINCSNCSRPLLDHTRPSHDHSRPQPDNHSDLLSIIPFSTRSLTRYLLNQLDIYTIRTRRARPGRTEVVNWSCMKAAVISAGSVHKSRDDNVVHMWVQLKR